MRRNLKKTYYLRKRIPKRTSEGSSYTDYADGIEIKARIWPAGGRIQAEMYGERLTYIKNMEYDGQESMQEGDGVCVFVGADEAPDYKIISIKPEYNPKLMELEAL